MAPSDASGNYSLPNGYLATAGTTILPSEHNPPFEDVAAGLTARLMRSGAGGMAGPLKLVDGTAPLPGLTFTSDPSSGLYKTPNGVGVAIDGVKVAEFLPGGVVGARFLGELIPFTCVAAPALCVLPFGQTLLRASYPDLWAQAQIEIAAGNTLYNNGNGSTTFGIMDMRGRVPVGQDNMGGTAANRVTTGGSGVNGAVLGAAGGFEAITLNAGQIPTIQSGGSIAVTAAGGGIIPVTAIFSGQVFVPSGGGGANFIAPAGSAWSSVASLGGSASNWLSNNTGGLPHIDMQPSIITNYILFAGA